MTSGAYLFCGLSKVLRFQEYRSFQNEVKYSLYLEFYVMTKLGTISTDHEEQKLSFKRNVLELKLECGKVDNDDCLNAGSPNAVSSSIKKTEEQYLEALFIIHLLTCVIGRSVLRMCAYRNDQRTSDLHLD
ncbi:hypothetical protein ACTXT7_011066 [Hymenolepis weldensis]